MRQFLRQCIDRYVELAGPNVKFKKVSTPFPDDKIARPIMDEAEARGELQPIASRVLMKVLFAARMARFDLLRATQGLASRVTKWSPDCDKSLHRLMCYIHSFNPWSYNGWFRWGSTWVLQNLVICRFRSCWGTRQSFNKWLPPCISRTKHVLSTHSFFQEADFNGYVIDRGGSHCGEPCFACCWFTFLLPVVSHTSRGGR